MFKKIIFQGWIPHLMTVKKIFLVLALVLPFSVFFNYMKFPLYAKVGWYVLVGVLSTRPLADIFPDLRILRTLIAFRREFGIFSGMMIFAHFIGFLLAGNIPFFSIFKESMYWDYKVFLLWGILGLTVAVIVLMTSNNFSMRILKGWWKVIQRFSYLFLLFGGIHIMMIGKTNSIIEVSIVSILWLLAMFKFKIKFPWLHKEQI